MAWIWFSLVSVMALLTWRLVTVRTRPRRLMARLVRSLVVVERAATDGLDTIGGAVGHTVVTEEMSLSGRTRREIFVEPTYFLSPFGSNIAPLLTTSLHTARIFAPEVAHALMALKSALGAHQSAGAQVVDRDGACQRIEALLRPLTVLIPALDDVMASSPDFVARTRTAVAAERLDAIVGVTVPPLTEARRRTYDVQ